MPKAIIRTKSGREEEVYVSPFMENLLSLLSDGSAEELRAANERLAKVKGARLQFVNIGQKPLCESGWTGDRCTFPLFHEGDHSNERNPNA